VKVAFCSAKFQNTQFETKNKGRTTKGTFTIESAAEPGTLQKMGLNY